MKRALLTGALSLALSGGVLLAATSSSGRSMSQPAQVQTAVYSPSGQAMMVRVDDHDKWKHERHEMEERRERAQRNYYRNRTYQYNPYNNGYYNYSYNPYSSPYNNGYYVYRGYDPNYGYYNAYPNNGYYNAYPNNGYTYYGYQNNNRAYRQWRRHEEHERHERMERRRGDRR